MNLLKLFEEHPVFIAPDDKKNKIWRYMDFPKLISMLEKDALFFVRTDKLFDPYEGTIPEYNERMKRTVYSEYRSKFKDEAQFNRFVDSRASSQLNSDFRIPKHKFQFSSSLGPLKSCSSDQEMKLEKSEEISARAANFTIER